MKSTQFVLIDMAQQPKRRWIGALERSGARVLAERSITGADVRKRGLARLHLQADFGLATEGSLTVNDRARLLLALDRPDLAGRWGHRARAFDVVPVERLIAAGDVRREEVLSRFCWPTTNPDFGTLPIGDRLEAAVFEPPRRSAGPVIVLNPALPALLDALEMPARRMLAALIQWDAGADCADAVCSELGGVLLTSEHGPVAHLRSGHVWFDMDPALTELGIVCASHGIEPARLVDHTYLFLMGERRVLADLTRHFGAERVVDAIKCGVLQQRCSAPWLDSAAHLVDVAFAERDRILEEETAHAIFVSGSVARGRASSESDVDMFAIVERDDRPARETRLVCGRRLDLQRLTMEQVDTLLKHPEPGLKELREAARIGGSLPIWDPTGLVTRLRDRSSALRPPEGLVAKWIERSIHVLQLWASGALNAEDSWEALRIAADNLAMAALSMAPVRYHKPKWVSFDLWSAGHSSLSRLLVDAYGIRPETTRAEVNGEIDAARALMDWVADVCGLPPYQEAVAMGYAPRVVGFSLACRTHSDACALVQQHRFADACYVSRFSARLAATLAAEARSPLEGVGRTAALESHYGTEARALYERAAMLPSQPPGHALYDRVTEAIVHVSEAARNLYGDAV